MTALTVQLSFTSLCAYILKETSNAKSELVLLEWTPRLCLRFVLYDMSLVNTFIIALYGVMNYLLHSPNYSRPSVTRAPMAHLPRLFQTRSWVPLKNPISADLE